MSYFDSDCSCDYDYDRPQVYSRQAIKAARKQHKCEECGGIIKSGQPCEYVFSVYDGMPHGSHTCKYCVELRRWAIISVPCFCWSHGNMLEEVKDMVHEVSHKVPGMFFEYGRRVIKAKRERVYA